MLKNFLQENFKHPKIVLECLTSEQIEKIEKDIYKKVPKSIIKQNINYYLRELKNV